MKTGTAEPNLQVTSFTVFENEGRFEVFADIHRLGEDCLVIIWGGTIPHIGAVAMGQVRPSLRNPETLAATSSVFTYVGHKEDIVAKGMAEELTRRLDKKTVVVAGIHWDNLTDDDIKTIARICQRLTGKIIDNFG